MTTGLGPETVGVVVSIDTEWIWLVPLWGWGSEHLHGPGVQCPMDGRMLLALSALGTETMDGAGNLLFLRAVHAYERSEMTTVFVSFRDVAQLGPPVVCSLLLTVFGLPSVFVAGGLMMLAAASLSGRIPRRR